ncbi:MAG TPA: hypothetical protein VK869_11335 [Rubrobacteraceae bacterium]|nr:hypothetical protein [Rubrobacteraceae bacterium]
MILARLLGLGAAYGLAFMIIKSLFPSPLALLALQGGGSTEGNLTWLVLVYMSVGLVAGLVAAPIFGGLLLLGRRPGRSASTLGPRLALSLALALLMGVVSGLLTILAYATGVLPSGGVLDPLELIESSAFSPGTLLLIAWTIARDLLPAGLTGLFLAPITGGILARLYAGEHRAGQKRYEWEE